MFDLDRFYEIWQTLRRNRLRTFLTACGIFWGVFMLVIMLGFGSGLQKGVMEDLGFYAINTRYIMGEVTTKPHAGRKVGQPIFMTLGDVEAVRQVPGVETAFGRSQNFALTASRDNKTHQVTFSGDYPQILDTEFSTLVRGRFLNAADIAEHRKVAVIGSLVKERLFGPEEDPLGKTIRLANTVWEIVGVLDATGASALRREFMNSRVFAPHPVWARIFKARDRVGNLMVLTDPKRLGSEVEQDIKKLLIKRHHIAPDDDRAIRIFSRDVSFARLSALFQAILVLTWVVGSLTLLAGAIGVSNIMMIAVAERSREIGIRKALGATPMSIIVQVVAESTFLTALAGYLGLIVGVGVLEVVGKIVASMPSDAQAPSFFASPELDLGRALLAAILLTIAGGLAGLAPARAAAAVRPIEALAHE